VSLYARLGVTASATPDELREAWRGLVHALHPDRHPNDPGAVERLAAINAAYTVLSDPVELPRSCAACAGTGWRRAGRACSKCEGGVIPGIGPYRMQIPRGVVDGQVWVVARVAATFSRSAQEVIVQVPCPVQLRRDGGRVRVPLPSGKAVMMMVPAGSSVGRRLRLRGKGGAGVDLIAELVQGPPPPVPVAALKIHLG